MILLHFQVDTESATVGRAAIGNMLGGIGYFYGQSRIALPMDSNVSICPSVRFTLLSASLKVDVYFGISLLNADFFEMVAC